MDKEGADNWPYKDMTTYVITHLPDEDTEAIKFVNTRMSTFLQKLLQEEGKDIWIYGGSDIANQVIRENMVDEYHLTIHPDHSRRRREII